MAARVMSHTPVPVGSPRGWVLYASHASFPVVRLVIFVHGFMGKVVTTWHDFPDGASDRHWWQESDLLFVSYRSTRENIGGVANRLRREVPRFYPVPNVEAMTVNGTAPREDLSRPYEELVLVGHSLGGLVVRKALCDAAQAWKDARRDPGKRSCLLDSKVRLFSPAISGFRAAGALGLLKATNIWQTVEMFVRTASAYSDLQAGSETLTSTRRRTEALAVESGMDALRVQIVWANPDNVVVAERYDTDPVDDSLDNTSHGTVCKPKRGVYEAPWTFVELGQPQ